MSFSKLIGSPPLCHSIFTGSVPRTNSQANSLGLLRTTKTASISGSLSSVGERSLAVDVRRMVGFSKGYIENAQQIKVVKDKTRDKTN